MGKKYKNLFEKIIDPQNIQRAYMKAARGKRSTRGFLAFEQNRATNMAIIKEALESGTYIPNDPNRFPIYEPKERMIEALPFMDRVSEHAINNIIEPIFEKAFLPQSYACRKNKGTHKAAGDVQAAARRMLEKGKVWFLKTDFSKYFASISRLNIWKMIKKKISCIPTLGLLKRLLFAVAGGLQIGRLSSQLYANLHGHIVDAWLVHKVRFTRFFRYMDDIVFLAYSKEALDLLKLRLEFFITNELGLRFSYWFIHPMNRGVNYVGYRIWPTHKLLRKDSVVRAKRKLKRLSGEKRDRFLVAWLGHARHANTHNLLTRMEIA